MIFQPRYLVLDTAHLNRWADSKVSQHATRREEARRWEDWLERSGYVVLLCMHHISEMASHVEEIAAERLRFLSNLPFVAWIGVAPDRAPGTVVTVLGQEVLAALDNPTASWREVRDEARLRLIQTGTGAQMLGAEPEAWLALRSEFTAQTARARQIVAFSRLKTVDIADKPMSELLNGRLRRDEDLLRQLDIMEGTYAVNIAQRGDRRISDPSALAAEFMQAAAHLAEPLPSTASELVLRSLAKQGVGEGDIGPKSTVGEILSLGLFRSHVRVAAKSVGITDPQALCRIRPEQIPTWSIAQALEGNLPDVPLREGSEINDTYLACLTAYADVTLVDKRTLEGVRRLRQNDFYVASMLGRISRAAKLQDIIAMLSA